MQLISLTVFLMLPQTHCYYCKVNINFRNLCVGVYAVIGIPGLLSAVGSLSLNSTPFTITLTWTRPFTLDIAGDGPDITGYCVDVVIDKLSSSTCLSNCDINNTEFQYTLPPDRGCHDSYMFIVAPINIVGIGLPANMSYFQKLRGNMKVYAF